MVHVNWWIPWIFQRLRIFKEYAYNIVPTPNSADKMRLVWSETAICVVAVVIVVGSLFLLKSRYRLARDILDTANKAAKAHWSVFWTVLMGETSVGGQQSCKTHIFSRFNYPMPECYLERVYLYSCSPSVWALAQKYAVIAFHSVINTNTC